MRFKQESVSVLVAVVFGFGFSAGCLMYA